MISQSQWIRIIEKINKILGVDDIATAPDKLMKILQNRQEREQVFKKNVRIICS